MNRFKVVVRAAGDEWFPDTLYGICHADASPLKWADAGLEGTFDECQDLCREYMAGEESAVALAQSEYYTCINYYTKQIVIMVGHNSEGFPTVEDENYGWYFEQKGEAETFALLTEYREQHGAGVTHIVLKRPTDWWTNFNDPSYHQIFASTDPIPDGMQVREGGSLDECHKFIERIAQIPDDEEPGTGVW